MLHHSMCGEIKNTHIPQHKQTTPEWQEIVQKPPTAKSGKKYILESGKQTISVAHAHQEKYLKAQF